MRCHYLSDLHLECQDFNGPLPRGDVLIIAGDLCHARCLDPACTDKYSIDQRARVHRFIDKAVTNFAHVLLIAGNHEHYDGVFDDTAGLLRRHLRGVTVLDNDHIEIGGIRFFGTTLWSDFEGHSEVSMNAVRRRMGEYFFVKKRQRDVDGCTRLEKFRPEDALIAFDSSWASLVNVLALDNMPVVVISHHAPSLRGLNPRHAGNGLDGAYGSDLDARLAPYPNLKVWVHGHTHIKRAYTIGDTVVLANCRGFEKSDSGAQSFKAQPFFDI